jgi:hypothetical protein
MSSRTPPRKSRRRSGAEAVGRRMSVAGGVLGHEQTTSERWSALRPLEKVEEHGHTKRSERMDQRRQNGEHRNSIACKCYEISYEHRHKQDRKQRHADERQDCGILKGHHASMSTVCSICKPDICRHETECALVADCCGGTDLREHRNRRRMPSILNEVEFFCPSLSRRHWIGVFDTNA